MHAATLSINANQLVITTGIKALRIGCERSMQLFAHRDRRLVLPADITNPPLVILPETDVEGGIVHLALLSLSTDDSESVIAIGEHDSRNQVLLLIDTFDTGADACNTGEYSLPAHHDMRLPHGIAATPLGPARYGLVLFCPLDTCVIRSSGGYIKKIQLQEDGKFKAFRSDPFDRALMDGRL